MLSTIQELKSSFSKRPKHGYFILCKMLMFSYYSTLVQFQPFASLILAYAGGTAFEIGIVSAIRPFIACLMMPTIGFVADKIGRHKLILITLIVISCILRLSLVVPLYEAQDLKQLNSSSTNSSNPQFKKKSM